MACILVGSSHAQSPELISNYNVNVNVLSTGVIHVDETIDYFFSEPKHGIYRNIPRVKKNDKGTKYIFDIKNIQVVGDSNTPVQYSVSYSTDSLTLKIGDPQMTITGKHKYKISYDVSGALTYFDDHDELYWNLIGTDWQVSILNAAASVTFEPYMESRDLKVVCYTGSVGSKDQNCETLITKTPGVFIQSSYPLAPTQGLTGVISFPKGKVAVLEPRRDWFGELLALILLLIQLLWYVGLPFFVFYLYLKEKSNLSRKQKIVAAWFSPPKDPMGNLYTPALTGYIYDKKIDNKFITATIIHLAQRGFIKIKVESKDNITFYRTEKALNFQSPDITKYEKDVLEGLFDDGDKTEAALKKLKKDKTLAKNVSDFKSNIQKAIKPDKLFKWDPLNYAGLFIALGIGSIFMTWNFPLAIVCILFGAKSAPRTDLGIEKYSEAASLKNFLVSQNDQLDFQAENQMYFEKLLPYATVFGVEDIWIKRFGNLDIKVPDWYDGDISTFYALNSINHSIAGAVSSSVTYNNAKSSSGFSSGFSGGSSGGGGGGGGGGSW